MKGFVFTLDALFSLMIAATGLSVLFYFTYTAPSPYFIQYSSSSALLSSLASTKLSAITSIPLIGYISQQYAASGQNWPMSIGNPYNNGGNNYGPSAFTLDYVVAANSDIINGTIVSNYGNVYFGAGNVVYAVNVSTGNIAWTANSPYNSILGSAPYINATLLYGGMLIYATQADIVALNAYNGTTLWTTSTQYNPAAGEPDKDELQMKILLYGGKIITYSQNPDDSSSLLYSMYANNGTVAGSSQLSANYIQYFAISNGQMVMATSNNKVMMTTQVLNNSYDAGTIWSTNPSCTNPGYPAGISSYANIIAYGCGSSGNLINTNSNLAVSFTFADPVRGVSAYNGYFAFQKKAGITLTNSTTELWTNTFPSSFRPTILNATPVMSSQYIYSLWGNGYIAIENLSTGVMVASTQIPYSGPTNPYMALAYGRLFTSKGRYLMSFGPCPANPNESVLSAIGTFYLNGQGSCSDYLLGKMNPGNNYGISINGTARMQAAQFNGASSYISTEQIAGMSQFSLSLWLYQDAPQAAYTRIVSLDNFVIPYNGWTLLTSSNGQKAYMALFTSSGAEFDSCLEPIPSNTWQNIIVSYNGVIPLIYSNGTVCDSQNKGTIDSVTNLPLIIGGGDSQAPTGQFNGAIANVQLYNTSISSYQAEALYAGGVSGQPLSYSNLVAWWPLQGNANSYANVYSAGYPTNVIFNSITYNSITLQNSFSVTSQSVPLPLLNYTTGKYKLYNVGVYSWR